MSTALIAHAPADLDPQNEKTRRPCSEAGGFIGSFVFCSDHARTQTSGLPSRLTRFRPLVFVARCNIAEEYSLRSALASIMGANS